jgi:4-azaleucine resistance transporter AzlC
MSTRLQSLRQGIQAEFPLLVGVFPFGMIYGAAALRAGLTPALSQAMSSVVFAGSAQFVTAQLVHEAAPALVIILTIGIVNLRHMLYSASVAPFVQDLSMRWKVLLSYLLTDEAYAAVIVHYETVGITPTGHWFFLGAGASLWLTWQVSTALGIFLGATIPESWPLEFALPLTFIAMLVPMLKDRAIVAAALAAGLVAVLGAALPYKLGLVLAALIGIGVGVLMERRR